MTTASSPGSGAPDPQADVVAFLEGGDAFAPGTPPERIDTHAASATMRC